METKGNTARNSSWGSSPASQHGTSVGGFICSPPPHWEGTQGKAGRGSPAPGYPPPPSGKAASIQWLRQKDTKVTMGGARLAK